MPRLEPLPEPEWTDRVRERIEATAELGGPYPLNVFTTLAHSPRLFSDWFRFSSRLLLRTSLPVRERELVILRVAWLCRSDYEWGQHARIARSIGIGDDELARVAAGPEGGWVGDDRLVLEVCDQLHHDHTIDDARWAALTSRYDTEQVLDLVMLAGQYTMLAGILNAAGVEREVGVEGLPEVSA